MIQPKPQPNRIRNPRTARSATHNRIARNSRARYVSVVRVSIAVGAVLVVLMIYVMLTSNLTGLTYAVSNAREKRAALLEQTQRLDDQIAVLRSDDRLATVAAKLGMREPQRFAVVKLPVPSTADTRPQFAFPSIAGFFMPASVRQR